MKKRKIFVIITSSFLTIFICLLISFVGLFIYAKKNIDYKTDEELFVKSSDSTVTKFYYNEGAENSGKYSPKEFSALFPAENKRIRVEYSDICDHLKNAFIASEDRGFFNHNGVDLKRTGLAALNHIFHFKSKFGGSTITQQVVKNISGDSEQTVKRKLSEILRAVNIEKTHTKEEIFEVYLNIAPMGNGISGVALASSVYFAKDPDELTLAEAATLAGITNAPSKFDPYTNINECREKRNRVLYAMHECNFISDEEYKSASEEPLRIAQKNEKTYNIQSWFIETVCDDVARDIAQAKNISVSAARMLMLGGGYSIYTTVNPNLQRMLEAYFENQKNFPSSVEEGLEFSMVITDSLTGDLLAVVGSVGQKSANRLLNHATSPKIPASALKPLALYAPLINSKRVHWATVLDDVPLEFISNGTDNLIEYPKNSPSVYDGLLTLSDGLRLSKNTIALRLYNMSNKEAIFENLYENFGFKTLVRAEKNNSGRLLTDIAPSPLALGQLTYGVPLRTLTEAYTVFANEGVLNNGRSYVSVFDSTGKLVLENPKTEKRIFSTECARVMNQLLMKVTESGTASSVSLKNIVDTAGKTGTAGADKSRIFVGYTAYLTAGIWCGYPANDRSIGSIEKSHLAVWDEIMQMAHSIILESTEQIKHFSTEGLEHKAFCKDSGGLYCPDCMLDVRGVRMEYGYFIPGTAPSVPCKRHVLVEYDVLTEGVATAGCDRENIVRVALLDIRDRKFPKQIYITDAEYVYRPVNTGDKLGDSFDIPYFQFTIPEGEYVGISRRKKQFNSSCYLHDD